MADNAQFVSIVAFFRREVDAQWRVVIPIANGEKSDPVKLVVTGNRLEAAVQ